MTERSPGQPQAELRIRLCGDVSVETAADGRSTLVTPRGGRLTLNAPTPGQGAVLQGLSGPGATEQALCDALAGTDGPNALPWFFMLLTQAGRGGLVETALLAEGREFAVLQPFSRNYQIGMRALPDDRPVRLCRFAYVRSVDGVLVLESPRAHARMLLPDGRAAALLAALAAPRLLADVAAAADVAPAPQRDRLFFSLLASHDFIEVGDTPPDEAAARDQWEFHDLLFHGRSRSGRHLYPWGATYRWAGVHDPLPAVKDMAGVSIPLRRPDLADLERSDPSLTTVIEGRRSRRIPGPMPLTLDQLGELLFRTSRVRARTRTDHEEVSSRPYPGGGADYELEIYPVVNRVEGLAAGLYYYHPLNNVLHPIEAGAPDRAALFRDAAQKARLEVFPDVLLCFTARFQRLSFKYSSIAYAVMLKDLGALYQNLYLVATAMGLAPCALGSGDIELFARASGLSPMIEPSVGEFMLSTLNEAG